MTAFSKADCTCPGYNLPPYDASRSSGGSTVDSAGLDCWFEETHRAGSVTFQTTPTFHITESSTPDPAQRGYTGHARNIALPPATLGGNPVTVHEYIPPGPDRYSLLYSYPQFSKTVTYFRGERGLLYKSRYEIYPSVTVVSDSATPGTVLALLNATEACAKMKIDEKETGAAAGPAQPGVSPAAGAPGGSAGAGSTNAGGGNPGDAAVLLAALAALLGFLYLGSKWYGSRAAGQDAGDPPGQDAGTEENGGGADENPNLCYD